MTALDTAALRTSTHVRALMRRIVALRLVDEVLARMEAADPDG